MFSQEIIVIEGPTASGKTALAIEVAKALDTVIISSDSRQFYREMSIGTAKPTDEELSQVQHYFVNSHSIHAPLSSGQFAEEARELLRSAEFNDYRFIVVTGGSGMFTDALVTGLDEMPSDPEIQKRLTEQFRTEGLASLLQELQSLDPDYFDTVDKENSRRVIRALEVAQLTGLPYSSFRTASALDPENVHRFHLVPDRALLYKRINERVDKMMIAGLLEEVESLLPFEELRPLQTVGYQELFSFLHGESSLEEVVELIKQHTRNYAKRQMTWFRRKEANILSGKSTDARKQEILELLGLGQHGDPKGTIRKT